MGRASRVPPSGFEKAVEFCFSAQGETRTLKPLRAKDFKSFVYTIPPPGHIIYRLRLDQKNVPGVGRGDFLSPSLFTHLGIILRPGWESNPRIRVLQTHALPLGYPAKIVTDLF